MKKLVLFAVILLGFSAMAVAQDVPIAEVFGGFSYLHCDAGDDLSCNLYGWNASVAFNGNKWLGVVVDVSGQYGKTGEVDNNVHSILVGPKVAIRKGKVTPFAQFLIGNARINRGEFDSSMNQFGMTAGGGLDFNVNDRIALRPAQAEYFGIKIGNGFTNNFRYSAGIIFKLGKR